MFFTIEKDDTISDAPSSCCISRSYLFIFVILGLVLTLVYLPNFFKSPGRDSGVFLYVAQQILDGKLPYVDLWDHKPPMIYLINVLGLYIGNGSVAGVRTIELLSLYLTTVLAFTALKDVFGVLPALIATIVMILNLPSLLETNNFTEEYAILCQTGAISLFIFSEKNKSLWPYFFIGLLASFSFFLRQNLVGFWIALAFYILIDGENLKEKLKKMGFAAFGFTIITLLVFGFFYLNNGLAQFWDDAFIYNFSYSSGTRLLSKLYAIGYGLSEFWVSPFIIISWFAMMFSCLRDKHKGRIQYSVLLITILWFPVELILSSMSGRTYDHYFIMYIPVLIVLLSYLFRIIFNQSLLKAEIIKTFTVRSALIALILAISGVTQAKVMYSRYYRHVFLNQVDKYRQVASYVLSTTGKNAYVLVWGADPVVNFLSKRTSPTRFFYQYPLVTRKYTNGRMISEFIKDVKIKRPNLIIDSKNPCFPPIDGEERKKWHLIGKRKSIGYIDMSFNFKDLFLFVKKNYILKKKIGRWDIYGIRRNLPESVKPSSFCFMAPRVLDLH